MLRFIMGRGFIHIRIILTVVDVRQAVLLQRFIDEVDPQAFLMVTKSSEVVGKGFMSYI